jgi:guanosine-3',5'-bis(diphosphate) 3'-pyrophosphohydrolase
VGSYDTWSIDIKAPRGKYRLIEISALKGPGNHKIIGDYDSLQAALGVVAMDSDPVYRFIVYDDHGNALSDKKGDWFKEKIRAGTGSDAAETVTDRQSIKSKIELAEAFADEKHRGQLRKNRVTPYVEHLRLVVASARLLGITDEDILCSAWLHDTIEDTNTDFDDIAEKFGGQTAEIVAQVTKDKRLPEEIREEQYAVQLSRASWKAQIIKFCDIWANIADLKSGYPQLEQRKRQVLNKLQYIKSIKDGLREHKSNIPNLQKGVDDLNLLLAEYGVESISI